jgi:hypothetical protein
MNSLKYSYSNINFWFKIIQICSNYSCILLIFQQFLALPHLRVSGNDGYGHPKELRCRFWFHFASNWRKQTWTESDKSCSML